MSVDYWNKILKESPFSIRRLLGATYFFVYFFLSSHAVYGVDRNGTHKAGPIELNKSCRALFASFIKGEIPTGILQKVKKLDESKWRPIQEFLRKKIRPGITLSEKQKIAIVAAFEVGKGQRGLSREAYAGIDQDGSSNYSGRHIALKFDLLTQAGFKEEELEALTDRPELLGFSTSVGQQIHHAFLRLQKYREPLLARFQARTKNDASFIQMPTWKGDGKFKYRNAYDRIRVLFNSESTNYIFDLMQTLELEVMIRTVQEGIMGHEAFQKILLEWEKAHEFKKTRELENTVYTATEWKEMLRAGSLFQDSPVLKDPYHLHNNFYAHGYDTHRIQWHLVMRDMALHPQYYQEEDETLPFASDLFKYLGHRKLIKGLDWSKTGFEGYRESRGTDPYPGSQSLWDALFEGDGFQHDFHNPIFIRRMLDEPQSMIWPSLVNISQ